MATRRAPEQRGEPTDPSGSRGVDTAGARLAELVAHLSSCPGDVAIDAVARSLPEGLGAVADLPADERLGVVARSLVVVRRRFDLRDQRPA